MFTFGKKSSFCYCRKHIFDRNDITYFIVSLLFWLLALTLEVIRYNLFQEVIYGLYIHCIVYILYIIGIINILSLAKNYPCYYHYKSIHKKLFWLAIFVFTMSAASRIPKYIYNNTLYIILMKYYIIVTVIIGVIVLIDVIILYNKVYHRYNNRSCSGNQGRMGSGYPNSLNK